MKNNNKTSKILKGIPASPGIAIGQVHLMDSDDLSVMKKSIKESEVSKEILRFEEAHIKTREDISDIKESIEQNSSVK